VNVFLVNQNVMRRKGEEHTSSSLQEKDIKIIRKRTRMETEEEARKGTFYAKRQNKIGNDHVELGNVQRPLGRADDRGE